MVVAFSMLGGERQIPCAVSASAMDELEDSRRQSPTSAKHNSFGCVIGSKSVPLASFSQWNSKALRLVSLCVTWIFERAQSGWLLLAGYSRAYA